MVSFNVIFSFKLLRVCIIFELAQSINNKDSICAIIQVIKNPLFYKTIAESLKPFLDNKTIYSKNNTSFFANSASSTVSSSIHFRLPTSIENIFSPSLIVSSKAAS